MKYLNRQPSGRAARGGTYTFNKADQLEVGPTYSYQYDKDGNLTGKVGYIEGGAFASWSYQYDYENRLIKVTKTGEDETTVVSFKYDPFGRRIEKRVEEHEGRDNDAKVTTYVYGYRGAWSFPSQTTFPFQPEQGPALHIQHSAHSSRYRSHTPTPAARILRAV